jgi:hypothetical protein
LKSGSATGPDRKHVSTSSIQQHPTMRMHMVALYTVWYNFARIHKVAHSWQRWLANARNSHGL